MLFNYPCLFQLFKVICWIYLVEFCIFLLTILVYFVTVSKWMSADFLEYVRHCNEILLPHEEVAFHASRNLNLLRCNLWVGVHFTQNVLESPFDWKLFYHQPSCFSVMECISVHRSDCVTKNSVSFGIFWNTFMIETISVALWYFVSCELSCTAFCCCFSWSKLELISKRTSWQVLVA